MRGFASNAVMAQGYHNEYKEPMSVHCDSNEICDCNRRQHPEHRREMELARAHVPFQQINELYSPRESLAKGTVFPELYMPYY